MPKYSMITSRGCPHLCAFCQSGRARVIDRILPNMLSMRYKNSLRFTVQKISPLLILCFVPINSEYMKSAMRFLLVVWRRKPLDLPSRVEVVDKLFGKWKSLGCWRTRFGGGLVMTKYLILFQEDNSRKD